VLYTDVAKRDLDVAYVAMVIHVCYKLLFLMFHLFSQTYVASVFIWILHMFRTYVTSVLFECCVCFTMIFKCFPCVFVSVSDACFKCFIYLQMYVAMLHMDVSNVDRVLHISLLAFFLLPRLGVSSS
jgi:hypothetical protein